MNLGDASWLTLAEVIHKSNFSDIEARRIVKRFGRFLAPRNFGDIVKYPPAAVEAVILIAELYRQGCTTEEITGILNYKDQNPPESLHSQLQREVGTLLILQNQACQLLRSTFEMVQNLISEVAILAAKLEAAEVEIQNLRGEKPTPEAGAEDLKRENLN